ncbi:hypothetical protein P2H44_19810 [Albimonas sp. CAU 1670]|uniref:DUF6962 family protein n=1 Tax=Albimonas sp. CAU 1670 TaxID=3032599 RepID=UPI0023D9F5D6|nr:hypothetical protein [Albimonas sp. CAU 1670]MDF2234813.1 hypothetical protein [Albimonas sp. CAU 1670]
MTDLEISALTDVILACEAFFLAGLAARREMAPGSPAFAFAAYLFLGALAFLLGAIDHTFLEPTHHPLNPAMKAATRIVATVSSLALLAMTARAFLGRRAGRITILAGAAAAAAVVVHILLEDNFFVPLAAQLVVVLALLILSGRAALRGEASPLLPLAAALMIATGMLPPLGVSVAGLGLYGTFHVAVMGTVLVLYLGGRTLPAVSLRR